jgi:hypothetical protein
MDENRDEYRNKVLTATTYVGQATHRPRREDDKARGLTIGYPQTKGSDAGVALTIHDAKIANSRASIVEVVNRVGASEPILERSADKLVTMRPPGESFSDGTHRPAVESGPIKSGV